MMQYLIVMKTMNQVRLYVFYARFYGCILKKINKHFCIDILNNPSTSKVEFNSISSNPGKQDWDDYSPLLLKTPLSKQLVTLPSPADPVQVIIVITLHFVIL